MNKLARGANAQSEAIHLSSSSSSLPDEAMDQRLNSAHMVSLPEKVILYTLYFK
jgi:hypothetical protein